MFIDRVCAGESPGGVFASPPGTDPENTPNEEAKNRMEEAKSRNGEGTHSINDDGNDDGKAGGDEEVAQGPL